MNPSDLPPAQREPAALYHAREDVAAGNLWRARDRLTGALSHQSVEPSDPHHAIVLQLLGRVLFDMGDLPAAGRYWYALDLGREDPDVSRAIDAFEAKCGHHQATIQQHLRFLRRIALDPSDVARAEARRSVEGRSVISFGPNSEALRNYREIQSPSERIYMALWALLFIAVVATFIVGVVTIISWLATPS